MDPPVKVSKDKVIILLSLLAHNFSFGKCLRLHYVYCVSLLAHHEKV